MALSVRFDPTGPYDVDAVDTAFARPAGMELLARLYRPKGEPTRPLAALIYVHGGAWAQPDQDDNVPAAITEAFVAAYQRAGGRLERAHFPGARHGFAEEASPDTEKCIALVRNFIGGQLAG